MEESDLDIDDQVDQEGCNCDEIVHVMWTRRLKEVVDGGNNFVFDAFLYLESMQRSENIFSIGEPGSCNNSTSKRILDMLKAI